MGGISIFQLLMVFVIFGSFLLIPLLLTLFSKRARGAQKAGWVILVIFTSWIGYAVFLILSPLVSTSERQ